MSDSTQRKCKNVISKLQRRIDKDGLQVIPILYDWWKRNENSNFANPVTVPSNLLDLQQIELRVDSFEYGDVMDFIADVQLMMKNVVRQSNHSNEAKHEAGKLQGLFFDIMKIAFPDTDFREARNAVTFSSHGGASSTGPSSKPSRQPPPRQVERVEATPKSQKEITPASRSTRDHLPPERSPQLGDLVICKKKRNDRDKPAAKQRLGPMSPPSPGLSRSPSDTSRAALVSPPSATRSTRTPFQKDGQPAQVGRPQQPGSSGAAATFGVGEVQWAKPVKKLRTDTGKRRPSHM